MHPVLLHPERMTEINNQWFTLPVAVPLRGPHDVVLCREHARSLLGYVGAGAEEQVGLTAAISEIARIVLEFGVDGVVTFGIAAGSEGSKQDFVAIVSDPGERRQNLELALRGGCDSENGEGIGMQVVRDLVDDLQIESGPAGVTVMIVHHLKKAIEAPELEQFISESLKKRPVDPYRELASQNLEAARILRILRAQRTEFTQVTGELTETNRGVVALYDELETVSRLGRVIAAQLDLNSLLQAITEATTEISGAELGAFFYREPNDPHFRCHTVAGTLPFPLGDCRPIHPSDLFGGGSSSETLRIDDLEDTPIQLPVWSSLSFRSYMAIPIRDSSGEVTGTLIFGHNAPHTFSERGQRILDGLTDQISANIQNARLYQTVQSASAAKDHFLAVLSHELRTPLNPVLIATRMLSRRKDLPDGVADAVAMIERNVRLEAQMIDELLDLTRITRGKAEFVFAPMDVHEAIARAVEVSKPDIEAKSQRLTVELQASKQQLNGDARRLRQVFWNIFKNCSKFTPEGGEICVHSRNEPGKIVVEVRDTGIGFPAEAAERIFAAFEQVNEDVTRSFGGLGLGLAIARANLDGHSGTIRAHSAGPGKGATFTVVLPLGDS